MASPCGIVTATSSPSNDACPRSAQARYESYQLYSTLYICNFSRAVASCCADRETSLVGLFNHIGAGPRCKRAIDFLGLDRIYLMRSNNMAARSRRILFGDWLPMQSKIRTMAVAFRRTANIVLSKSSIVSLMAIIIFSLLGTPAPGFAQSGQVPVRLVQRLDQDQTSLVNPAGLFFSGNGDSIQIRKRHWIFLLYRHY